MNGTTFEDLKKAAELIRRYCADHACRDCPFSDEWGDSCALMEDLPSEWEIPE